MSPAELVELCQEWRQSVFSKREWEKADEEPINPGEAGGYRVRSPGFPLTAYLKPLRLCDENTPRAANEKIVADLAFELGANVPPVLLYKRSESLLGEETRCCVSLIMYPELFEWGFLRATSGLARPFQLMVQDALSRYSKTFALDILIGQTDRDNDRNVVLGADVSSPPQTAFLFLDHANSLNYGNRWSNQRWVNLEMPPIPGTFRASLRKELVLQGADEIARLSDETVVEIVRRMPDGYMSPVHKAVVASGLNGRKSLVRDFVERHL